MPLSTLTTKIINTVSNVIRMVSDKKLKEVTEASPLGGMMHSLKEEFHQIFEESKNLGEGTLKIIDWFKKPNPIIFRSVQTIKRWLAEVVGYARKKKNQRNS